MRTLLVVEDDPGLQSQLKWSLDAYEVILAGDREEALDGIRLHHPAVVVLDLGLPPDPANPTEGLAALEGMLALAPSTKVIVITGNDERDNAVRAIGLGAYDFFGKPIDVELLKLTLDRAFRTHDLEAENRRLAEVVRPSAIASVITGDKAMLDVCRLVEKIAPTDVTTLLLGESGTGKELFARALHELSPRARKPFVAINCAAIPETLLESELFGYEKGAFTGANKQTLGKVECADGGTLFLDEVGDLPLSMQSKLLRFLQERVIERVGGRAEIAVDVRVVCATHCDLKALAATGEFRQDLYYRISEITINIPPLRERVGDALLLANTFIKKCSLDYGRKPKRLSAAAVSAIEAHRWPGNVRELESCIKRAVVVADGAQLEPADMGLSFNEGDAPVFDLRAIREQAERQAIQRAIGLCGENVSMAAKMLGVTRPTLYDLLNKYGFK